MYVTLFKFLQEVTGGRYFVTFIDDHSMYCFTLKTKDELIDWFMVNKAKAGNQIEKNARS